MQASLRTMRDALGQLHDRIETLEARLKQHSTTSSQPPSADSPSKKPRRRTTSTPPRKAGGKLAGTYGNGRRMVQTFCASVLRVPISLGAIQKVLDRVVEAIEPHSLAIATPARHAPVNDIDETPWLLANALQWLWVMASDTAALSMMHPHRSKEAFAALIDDWAGILVSDGYGVYGNWVQARQTCLAHRIRAARGLAERQNAELAACGAWALAELQRLCHMAMAPRRVGNGTRGTLACAA